MYICAWNTPWADPFSATHGRTSWYEDKDGDNASKCDKNWEWYYAATFMANICVSTIAQWSFQVFLFDGITRRDRLAESEALNRQFTELVMNFSSVMESSKQVALSKWFILEPLLVGVLWISFCI